MSYFNVPTRREKTVLATVIGTTLLSCLYGIWCVACATGPLGEKPTLITEVKKGYEYKIVTTTPSTPAGDRASADIIIDEKALNDLGKDGWELGTSFPVTETVFPNFSENVKMVTGLQSNTRTKHVVLVFKRPIEY